MPKSTQGRSHVFERERNVPETTALQAPHAACTKMAHEIP